MSGRTAAGALLLASVLVLFPLAASGAPPVRQVGVSIDAGQARITSGLRDVFSAEVRDKLRSGLPTRVLIQVTLERQGRKKAVTYWARNVEVTYDLWEENFSIVIEDDRGRRRARVASVEEAVGIASTLWRVPVAGTAGLEPGLYRLRVLAETNPVSMEMVENIRRWLARSSTGGSGSASAESRTNFFGSFVGVFVDRRIGEADKSVAFVSQWFELGKR
ncbi:MAG TPA: DUF4390 domain-containing protein [Polyangia bacterium]|nr:DUF4390 domain-containing protein [Polyangia bacterium]